MSARGGGTADDVAAVLATAQVFAVPLVTRFRRVTVREGVLLRGPAGWAEFAPFDDYPDEVAASWLAAALDSALHPWPEPRREQVEVNATVPVVDPERAHALVAASGCRTAKVKVADPGSDPAADADRLAAVRDALGPDGRIRIDANAAWDVATALALLPRFADAAAGLEYVEQPCRTVAELAQVRRGTDVPVAADESIRLADDTLAVARAGAADVAVLKVAPLGGVRAVLDIAAAVDREAGMRVVVSSAVDTAVGIAAGVAAAAALPHDPGACGLATTRLLTRDVASRRPEPRDGLLPVHRSAPEPDLLEQCRADAATTARWRERLTRVAAVLATPHAGQQVAR